VKTGLAPDWEGSTSTYEAVRAMHPDIVDETVDLGELGIHLVNAAFDFEDAQKKFNEMKSRTLDALGGAKYGVVDDRKVCYRSSKSGGTPFLVVKK